MYRQSGDNFDGFDHLENAFVPAFWGVFVRGFGEFSITDSALSSSVTYGSRSGTFSQVNAVAPPGTDMSCVSLSAQPDYQPSALSLTVSVTSTCATTSTSTTGDPDGGSGGGGGSGLPLGAIIGIAVGAVVVGIAVALTVFLALRRQNKKKDELFRATIAAESKADRDRAIEMSQANLRRFHASNE